MKTGAKIAISAVALCWVAIAALAASWVIHHARRPGKLGQSMEVRLVAINGGLFAYGTASGFDVFQESVMRTYVESGQAPAGWKWLPVANGVEQEITGDAPVGSESEYISRVSEGRMFLLVADRQDMMLGHDNKTRPWGVEVADVKSENDVPVVEILLDRAGGDLMEDFTQKYVHHRTAMVIDGEICDLAMIQSPVRSAFEIRLPRGQQSEARILRDALMK